jgi:hypothetical protein
MSALNNPSEHMNFRDVRRLLAAGSPGSAWKGKVAKPTDVQGIRFPSKIQAAVYSTLMLNAARNRTITGSSAKPSIVRTSAPSQATWQVVPFQCACSLPYPPSTI